MKYQKLEEHLHRQSAAEVPMTFVEIEKLIGQALPPSARKHRPWWSNNPSNSVITKAWLDAGYKTERVDMGGGRLVFRRVKGSPPPAQRPAQNDPLAGIFGALRGTIRLLPGVDLTQPTGEKWAAEGDE